MCMKLKSVYVHTSCFYSPVYSINFDERHLKLKFSHNGTIFHHESFDTGILTKDRTLWASYLPYIRAGS